MIIQSTNMAKSTKPDANGRIRDRGMKTYNTVFNELKKFLRGEVVTKPIPQGSDMVFTQPVPRDAVAWCTVGYGDGNVVTYVTIASSNLNEPATPRLLAIIEGPPQTMDGVHRMALLAAKCELFLNGKGKIFVREDTPVHLTADETVMLRKAVKEYYTDTHLKKPMLEKIDRLALRQPGTVTTFNHRLYDTIDECREGPSNCSYAEYAGYLREYLEKTGTLNDVSFHFHGDQFAENEPMSDFEFIDYRVHLHDTGHTSFTMIALNDNHTRRCFVTCTSNDMGTDAFFRMHALAGECFYLMNSGGESYDRQYIQMEFDSTETKYLREAIEDLMPSNMPDEDKASLEQVQFYLDFNSK